MFTRKLFMLQLAGMWPKGCMDNNGIKRAIGKAISRRKALNDHKVLIIIGHTVSSEA